MTMQKNISHTVFSSSRFLHRRTAAINFVLYKISCWISMHGPDEKSLFKLLQHTRKHSLKTYDFPCNTVAWVIVFNALVYSNLNVYKWFKEDVTLRVLRLTNVWSAYCYPWGVQVLLVPHLSHSPLPENQVPVQAAPSASSPQLVTASHSPVCLHW